MEPVVNTKETPEFNLKLAERLEETFPLLYAEIEAYTLRIASRISPDAEQLDPTIKADLQPHLVPLRESTAAYIRVRAYFSFCLCNGFTIYEQMLRWFGRTYQKQYVGNLCLNSTCPPELWKSRSAYLEMYARFKERVATFALVCP